MFNASPFGTRPYSADRQILPRFAAQYGWAAWTFSRSAKLNAWAWHGLSATSTGYIHAWAGLGGSVYMRRDGIDALYVMKPDTYVGATETSTESNTCFAETQWLDFGKPGELKSMSGFDFDGKNVLRVEVYTAPGGDRAGQLSETIQVSGSQAGWTYSGDVLPAQSHGTEFKLRFVGDPNLEVQINRLTIYFDSLGVA